jgi:hypothetical protein
MGYIEKVMSDGERFVYQTHRHIIVLLQRIALWLLAFVVFLGSGLAVLLGPGGPEGSSVRWWVGLVALAVLLVAVYLGVFAWMRGKRRGELFRQAWRPGIAGLVLVAVAVVWLLRPELRAVGWAAVALALAPLAGLIQSISDWLNERYIITNRRVMEVQGIVNKHIRDSALEKVNDVELTQSIVGRILRYGTVQIITGSDIGVNQFRRIANPVRFKRALLNAKEDLQRGAWAEEDDRRPAGRRLAADLALGELAAGEKVTDLIGELAELRRQGILSEEEFQIKKRELLDRI